MNRKDLLQRKASLVEKKEASMRTFLNAQREVSVYDGAIADCDFWLTKCPVEEPAKEPAEAK